MFANNTKKELSGRVKNFKAYPEGRTSLLTLVNRVNNDQIVPRHVNLCIPTADVTREKIALYSTILFQAADFQQWRIGTDRFLGTRQSNDRNDPKYRLPALTDMPTKLGKLGEWADVDYLISEGIDPELYLAEGVNPIWSLLGFDSDSVALVEAPKPDQPKVINVTTSPATTMADRANDYAHRAASEVDAAIVSAQ